MLSGIGMLTLLSEGGTAVAVDNIAAAVNGAIPFVIDSLAGFSIHAKEGLNDGIYGNSNSWIGNTAGYGGIRFSRMFTINSFAFGRDNSGVSNDRNIGDYTLQYTAVSSPGVSTSERCSISVQAGLPSHPLIGGTFTHFHRFRPQLFDCSSLTVMPIILEVIIEC